MSIISVSQAYVETRYAERAHQACEVAPPHLCRSMAAENEARGAAHAGGNDHSGQGSRQVESVAVDDDERITNAMSPPAATAWALILQRE